MENNPSVIIQDNQEGNTQYSNPPNRRSYHSKVGTGVNHRRLSSKLLRDIEKSERSNSEFSPVQLEVSTISNSLSSSSPSVENTSKVDQNKVQNKINTSLSLPNNMSNTQNTNALVEKSPFLKQDKQKVQAVSQLELISSQELLSPMEKVIKILKNLRSKAFANDVEDINFVLDTLLSSQRAYAPELFVSHSGSVDSDVKDWIVTQFMNSAQRGGKDEKVEKSSVAKRYQESKRFTMSVIEGNVPLTLQLEITDSWEFDVFKVHHLTQGHSLYTVGYWIFTRLGLVDKFKIPEKKLKAFLHQVEDHYKPDNLYHNSIHAADITQSVFAILTWGGLSKYLSDLDILALIFGAIVHDLDHPGTNNAYQVKSRSEKATIYNDISVLENHHLATAFQILLDDEFNLLINLPHESYSEFRESVIKSVLATDMAHHFDNVGRFKGKVVGADNSTFVNREDRLLLMCIALKAADISSPTKPAPLAVQWTERIMGEFFCQGDLERQKGMGVSPFMDRETTSIPKCQVAFIDFIVTPLWDVFVTVSPNLSDCLENLKSNRQMWKECVDKGITGIPDIQSLAPVNSAFG